MPGLLTAWTSAGLVSTAFSVSAIAPAASPCWKERNAKVLVAFSPLAGSSSSAHPILDNGLGGMPLVKSASPTPECAPASLGSICSAAANSSAACLEPSRPHQHQPKVVPRGNDGRVDPQRRPAFRRWHRPAAPAGRKWSRDCCAPRHCADRSATLPAPRQAPRRDSPFSAAHSQGRCALPFDPDRSPGIGEKAPPRHRSVPGPAAPRAKVIARHPGNPGSARASFSKSASSPEYIPHCIQVSVPSASAMPIPTPISSCRANGPNRSQPSRDSRGHQRTDAQRPVILPMIRDKGVAHHIEHDRQDQHGSAHVKMPSARQRAPCPPACEPATIR